MRPPGEIRRMTLGALAELARERREHQHRGATWRDAVQRLVPLGVSEDAVRNTMKNLARAGAIQPVGAVKVPDSARPLTAWEPASRRAGGDSAQALASVTRCWVAGG